jgi:hypothetical protein
MSFVSMQPGWNISLFRTSGAPIWADSGQTVQVPKSDNLQVLPPGRWVLSTC